MQLFIFGNSDLEIDSLPIKILPELEKQFPEHTFSVLDPNEEWDIPKNMVIIDTVLGIDSVTVFENLEVFLKTPRVTCHDFDAYTNLKFLKKLGKLDSVYILGLPPHLSEQEAVNALSKKIPSITQRNY